MLSQGINELLTARERGDDVTEHLGRIQETIKGLATEFGYMKEIFAQQDQMLAKQGMKIQLVPVA